MTKKEILIAFGLLVVIFSLLAALTYFIVNSDTNSMVSNTNTNIQTSNSNGPAKADIPTNGNDTIILTNTQTRIRIINEFNKNMLTAKKTLFIMFASWCPNCKDEILEIESIINYYKDNKDVNVIVIAHEFNDSNYPLDGLISLLENDVNYGDFEIWVDFGRVIRKAIDPEASTIPMSYVVNKNGKILAKHDTTLTLEKAQEMLK